MSTTDICQLCNVVVTARHQGLLCDGCLSWFHRRCTKDTECEMDQKTYRRLLGDGESFEWKCATCMRQDAECVSFIYDRFKVVTPCRFVL